MSADEYARAPAAVRTDMTVPHSRIEDLYAYATGCILIGLGLALLHAAGLVTGGIAGLALLASYMVPWPAGLLFTVINLPFFAFAGMVMGRGFLYRTLAVNAGIALFSLVTRDALSIAREHPAFAAIVGGTVIGMGILSAARHGAGVGGTGVVTLWLYRRSGINAGTSQIAIDLFILSLSLPVIAPAAILWSALSAAAMSGVLIAWHRPGRYLGA